TAGSPCAGIPPRRAGGGRAVPAIRCGLDRSLQVPWTAERRDRAARRRPLLGYGARRGTMQAPRTNAASRAAEGGPLAGNSDLPPANRHSGERGEASWRGEAAPAVAP